MLRSLVSVFLATVVSMPTSLVVGNDAPAAFDDATFLKTTAQGGLYDVCICKLVGSQTRNPEVRRFAAGVVADHIVASDWLRTAAKEVDVELPTKFDAAQQKQFEEFKVARGEKLDRQLVTILHNRLTLGAAGFALASKKAESPAVRAFATKTLPRIRKQLEVAKKLNK
jgi:putative membrane protein